MRVVISVLRGICQTPGYVAQETGLFEKQGLAVDLQVEPTAWAAPRKLAAGESHFAVIPWTRVAVAGRGEAPLVVICGSGVEEAALVVRAGLGLDQVRRVSVPRRGGMKDLTAMGLIESLGWGGVELLRQPSGDGAIISLFGRGVDAASMVEPYATMMEALGVGRVVRRTGDVWPGAPGCSLAATRALTRERRDLVQRVVNAFVAGAERVRERPDEAAEIAFRYIGIDPLIIRRALERSRPDVDAVRNGPAMQRILELMGTLGYVHGPPADYLDLSFLDGAARSPVDMHRGGASASPSTPAALVEGAL
jgi:ABC-type nitrate/sulfonate/bicarbonate transport system substrate-binding protein